MTAYELRKPPVTEPFFRKKRPPAPKPTAEQQREKEAPGHLAKIRKCPCCICGEPAPSHAHHLKSAAPRGMGQKVPNKWTLPLCVEHHLYGVERVGSQREEAWFLERGIECYELALALHSRNHGIEAMLEILKAHKSGSQVGE